MNFKVGDWVTTLSGETKQITEFSGEQSSTIIHSDGFMCYASDCEPWQPKKGEWCWFFDNPEYPDLRKFIEFNNDYFLASGSINYSNCEPFIGELPSFLKE